MYAVIKTGGKQYRVSQGDRLRVESLAADEGSTINFDEVLMVGEGGSVNIGSPLLADTSVSATVIGHGRGKKVDIIKFRRRKHHRKQMGHRQNYTEVEITGIPGAGPYTPRSKAAASPDAGDDAVETAAVEERVVETAAPSGPTGTLKFLSEPEGDKDDLTQISGVGPVLEGKLHEMGIFHFHQIAAFTQEDVDNVNREMDFPGRIERDEWISQAEELAKG